MSQSQKIIDLINAYWRFDNFQQPMSSWHDKQDLIDAIKKELLKNPYGLSESELKLFEKHKPKSIKFENGGGIGTKVSIFSDKEEWIDITDYDKW